jgi:hypothetical protein
MDKKWIREGSIKMFPINELGITCRIIIITAGPHVHLTLNTIFLLELQKQDHLH